MSEKMTPSDTICVLPWMHVSNTTSGHLQLCCKAADKYKMLRDSAGKIIRISDLSDYDVFWNSQQMRDIRLQMLRGERPNACTGCFEVEDAGAESHRQAKNIQFKPLLEKLVPQTEKDGRAPVHPALFDLRISNVCNLRCRMCTPHSSNQWIDDWNALYNDALKKSGEESELRKMNWYEKASFWQTIEKYGEYIEHIFFAGGEPTLIAQQHELLKGLIKTGYADRITLSYNTNVTYLPDSLLELWMSFKDVKIYCSIDGYGAVNDYIRYPSEWSLIEKNMQKIDSLLPELKSGQATVCTTVQVYNITRLHELFGYMLESFDHVLRFPFLETLVAPESLDIRILPQPIKELAAQRLTEYRDKYCNVWDTKDLWFVDDGYNTENEYHKYVMSTWSTKIDRIIQFMNSKDQTSHLKEFARRTRYFDRTREQSLASAVPELASLLVGV